MMETVETATTAELARLRERIRATERRLRATHAVSRVLAEDVSVDTAAPRLLAALASALDCTLASYWVIADGRLAARAAWATDDVRIDWQDECARRRFEPGSGIPGRVWRDRGPVWITDVASEYLSRQLAFDAERIRSGFGFPIAAGAELLGVIDLYTRHREEPDDQLVEVLRTAGGHFGQFLVASRVQEDLRREVSVSRAAAAELEKMNLELDQFAYAASHDLRAPLRGITSLATWIEEDLGTSMPKKVRGHPELLKGRATRMDRLINGLLELARVGRVRQRPERVDITELLHETIELLGTPEASRVMIIGAMPILHVERYALQQVFSNLIGNAIQHAGRHDVVVRISADERADEVELCVADNGIGIPPQHHERVWQMFQTLSSRDVVENTGIGLAIVKKHVEGNGGRAWIDPATREGATFRFTWPKKPVR